MLFNNLISALNKNCSEQEINLINRWRKEVEYFLDVGEKGWKSGQHFLDFGISNKFQLKLTFLANFQSPVGVAQKILKKQSGFTPYIDYVVENNLNCQVGITLTDEAIEYEFYMLPKEESDITDFPDKRFETLEKTPFLIGINNSGALAIYVKDGADAAFIKECELGFNFAGKEPEPRTLFYSHYKYHSGTWNKVKNCMQLHQLKTAEVHLLEATKSMYFSSLIPEINTLPYFNYCSSGAFTSFYFPVPPANLLA